MYVPPSYSTVEKHVEVDGSHFVSLDPSATFAPHQPQVLRAGGIPIEDVERLLGGNLADATGPSRASGMLESHYAPTAHIELVDDAADAAALMAATPHSEILDLSDDLVTYAHDLYARLRDADARGLGTLIAVMPPAQGLGHAIRDRLTKAAAPRPR